ncbi:hypothetical protein [Burkholderia ambifaria]|uniref:Uncharacterized protein n=1 Tax=Burkholderia ambifaria MEX-5 TaxID=396597 RepID=B1TBC2_9BURK|nr:hypothetical protein [Burkholderia ambifaria]EDT39146.1 hypothetical protein BamMEX5DRAFT_5088 [Burkholderia ambifaria MEX-5]
MCNTNTLEAVVNDFAGSLSVSDREVVRLLILNHQIRQSLVWYKEVADRYLRGPQAFDMINEIRKKYPNESVWKALDSSPETLIFEAGVILRETQALLNAS